MANGDSSNPLQQYGYDQNTAQQLAQSLGLTTSQLAAAFATTPATSVSQPQSGYTQNARAGAGPTTGMDLGSTVQQLQLMQAVGGLGGNQQQTGQAPSSTTVPLSNDPMNQMANWGAAGINSLGGTPVGAIYNPTPGQIPAGSKGGVSQVASPTSSATAPTAPNLNVASVFGPQNQQSQGLQAWTQQGGGSAADAAAIEKANGWAPGTIANKFYNQGVQQGTITPANPGPTTGGTPTPVMPANAAGAGARAATPYATAPPAAPGIDLATHGAGLEAAGKAIFAHYGGDPDSASHADIANFHQQLTNMIGGPSNAGATALGTGGPPAAPGAPPVKMATGGFVPGRGNTDTVPALLTPGEYVIPKSQAQQMGPLPQAARTGPGPLRMQGGGEVPDDPNEPSEARRRALTVAANSAAAANMPSQQGGQGQAPAAPGGQGTNFSQIIQQAQAARANQMYGTPSSATPAGGWPSQTPSVAPSYDVPSDPDPDWQYTGQPSTAGLTGAGTGGGMAGAAGAIGGLASGLSAAAQAYANSIKPWQMQKQDFGGAASAPPEQTVQLTQQQTQQPKQQQKSPMMTAQYGYNPYV